MARNRRKVGKVTQVASKFEDYSYLINGVAGVGKTTLVSEIGRKLFGLDGFMFLTVGQEPEPTHIGGVTRDVARTWDDLEEMIEDIYEYKNEDYPNLKMIALDSTNEIFRLAEANVVETYNKTVASEKKVNTIKQCYGGFQAGENKVIDQVINLLFKLNEVGVKLFFIGHTKQKNKVDLLTGIEFEQITSDLTSQYYNCIKDKVNVVMCAYVERKLTDVKTIQDAFSKKNKDVGRISSEERVITFRDEEYAIDVKSHLEYIVPKCNLDADIVIKEIQDAIRKQCEKYQGIVPNNALPSDALSKKDISTEIHKADSVDERSLKESKIDFIKSHMGNLDVSSLEKIMKKHKVMNFSDIDNVPMVCLDEITSLLK